MGYVGGVYIVWRFYAQAFRAWSEGHGGDVTFSVLFAVPLTVALVYEAVRQYRRRRIG
jgi:hypothetical protein